MSVFPIEQTPLIVPGLKLWVDSRNPFGDFTAPPDVTAMSIWNDLSGWGNHLGQASGGAQPIYLANGIKVGIPGISASSATYMNTAGGVFDSATYTIFVVCQPDILTTECDMLGTGSTANSDVLMMNFDGDFRGYSWTNTSSNVLTSPTASIDEPTIFIQKVSSDISIARNGIEDASAAMSGTQSNIMKPVYVNTRDGITVGQNVFGAVLIYDHALSSENENLILHYLGNRFGISTSNLPPPPGYEFLVDENGNFCVDSDGNFCVAPEP